MSVASDLVKRTFNKIFKKVAEELKEPVENVQLGIYYEGSSSKYESYRNFVKERNIELDEYLNILEMGLSSMIDSTIGQAGPRFAKECECETADVNIIMKYRENELPAAVLMVKGQKVRLVNIEEEFLT